MIVGNPTYIPWQGDTGCRYRTAQSTDIRVAVWGLQFSQHRRVTGHSCNLYINCLANALTRRGYYTAIFS